MTPDGKRAYELKFDAEHGPKDEVIGLDLVLADAQKERDSPGSNLLSPQKNWHGLQPYNFVGRDLAQGSGKSIFGSHRELKLESRKLVVQMDISNVKVSPLSNGDYQIDELEITVAVENLPA